MAKSQKLPLSADDLNVIKWFARHYVRPERSYLIAMAALLGLSAAATAGLAWVIKPVFDEMIIGQNPALLWILPLGIVAMVGVNGAALYGQGVMNTLIEQNVTMRLQRDLFGKIVRADTAYLDRTHTGLLIAQSTAFPGQVVMALLRVVTTFAGDIVMVVLLMGVVFFRDWQLASVTFLIVPFIALGVRYLNQRIRMRAEASLAMAVRVTARLTDLLNGLKLIKLQTAEGREEARFAALLAERRAVALNMARARSAASPIFEVAGGIGIGLVVFYAGVRASTGGPSFGTLASMMGALVMAYRPLKRIAATLATVQESLVVARGLKGALEYRPSVVDRPGAQPLRAAGGGIRFENVWFGYEPGRPVLKDVSFELEPGKVSALVGPSGGGKSTIVSLIPRLYDVDRGGIRIDGTDVRDVTLESLRRSIAVVSQETILFDDTVRANIAFGHPDASDAAVTAAAEAANAMGFIKQMPQGFDTVIGERGALLSGGQRQRLAIARAVLKDAPILLLDEATSAVDNESEQLIQAAIAKLLHGRTVLIVAHRLTTVVGASRIYVVDHGEISEAGAHHEMLRKDGVYARLYAMQSAEHSEWQG